MNPRSIDERELSRMLSGDRPLDSRDSNLLYQLRLLVEEVNLGPKNTMLRKKDVTKAERAIKAYARSKLAVEDAYMDALHTFEGR